VKENEYGNMKMFFIHLSENRTMRPVEIVLRRRV
jgi:hypothetical protein